MEMDISGLKHIATIDLHLYGLYKYLWHTLRRKMWKLRFPGKNILQL